MNRQNCLKKNNRGSSALLLAGMVSIGSLSVIYFTQKQAGHFLSTVSQSMEEWEKYLVSQSAQKLASYLVANNLIICRQGGWSGKQSKCQWSRAEGVEEPAIFNLQAETDSTSGLSYEGVYNIDEKQNRYKVSFHLESWKDTSIEPLVGGIPKYVCRKKSNRSLIPSVTCPDYADPSTNPTNQPCQRGDPPVNVPNSQCEYIEALDGDHWIVLITVEVPFIDPVSKKVHTHTAITGIRRPMSLISFESIRTGKRCSQACDVGTVAHFAPECRSSGKAREPGTYNGIGSQIITVKNEGPGALYKLSVLKMTTDLSTDKKTMEITPDLIKLDPNKEVLLPGKKMTFEWFYSCPPAVKKETVYKTGQKAGVSYAVRNEAVPFQRVAYAFQFSQNPTGQCYISQGRTLEATRDVDMVIPFDRETAGICVGGGLNCSSPSGVSGHCQYMDIEPARGFARIASESSNVRAMITTRTQTFTTAPPPPPPTITTPGQGSRGDGDGSDN